MRSLLPQALRPLLLAALLACRSEGLTLRPFAGDQLGGAAAHAVAELIRRSRPAALVTAVENDTALAVWADGCMVTMSRHPDDISCPAECPFLRIEPTRICEFKCVPPDECASDDPLVSFPDPITKHCGRCRAAACQACGSTSRSCATCQDGFTLFDGVCYDNYRWFWVSFYFLCVLAVIYVIMYVVLLAMRPTTNWEAAEAGLQFRFMSKSHNEATGQEYTIFGTDLRDTYVSGVGVMLHFSFQWWAAVYAGVVAAALAAAGLYFDVRPDISKHTLEESDYFKSCNAHVDNQKAVVMKMEVVYFFLVLAVYIFSLFGALFFAVRQRRLGARVSAETPTMQDYVLLVSGLPSLPGTKPVEELLTSAFQEQWNDLGVEIIGVSACWDYRGARDAVEAQVVEELEKLEDRRHGVSRKASSRSRPEGDESGGDDTETSPRTRELIKAALLSAEGSLSKEFRRLDQYLGFDGELDEVAAKAEAREQPEVRAMLEALYTTDQAYIVCRTEAHRNTLLEHIKANSTTIFGKPISAVAEDSEPQTVLWQNLGTKSRDIKLNIAIGCIMLVLAVFLLDIIFYFPSVAYLLSVSDVVGKTDGGMQATCLGLLVCACNQIIYLLIGMIADRCGFQSNDHHQRFYVVGYTAAVFINTMIDIGVVLLLANGYTTSQALTAHFGSGGDTSMSLKAISENPSVQMSVYIKYSEYIFPSCLLIPFLCEPVMNQFIFLLKKWVVRSREDVTVREAEIQLACKPFDLARYGDILINVMLCCGTLAFTYRDLYMLWVCLIISLVVIYWWDKYRFLRVSTRSMFVSQSLDSSAQYLTTVPCAIIAGCLAFRLYGMKDTVFLSRWTNFKEAVDAHNGVVSNLLNRDTILIVVFAAIGLHIVLHRLALKHVVERLTDVKVDKSERKSYETVCENLACNWFNGNPIHSLRSKYYYQHEVPVVPYAVGKEYLLTEAPEHGCYFINSVAREIRDNVNIAEDSLAKNVEQIKMGVAKFKNDFDEARKRAGTAIARSWSQRSGSFMEAAGSGSAQWPDSPKARSLASSGAAPSPWQSPRARLTAQSGQRSGAFMEAAGSGSVPWPDSPRQPPLSARSVASSGAAPSPRQSPRAAPLPE